MVCLCCRLVLIDACVPGLWDVWPRTLLILVSLPSTISQYRHQGYAPLAVAHQSECYITRGSFWINRKWPWILAISRFDRCQTMDDRTFIMNTGDIAVWSLQWMTGHSSCSIIVFKIPILNYKRLLGGVAAWLARVLHRYIGWRCIGYQCNMDRSCYTRIHGLTLTRREESSILVKRCYMVIQHSQSFM